MAYLYGASVQGIQGFIFETNKLKEIVGASDLIEQFCDKGFFEEFLNNDGKILRNAGGNIRISFDNENNVKHMVKHFPQMIMQKAYGITVSQAVVSYSENDKYLDIVDALEQKLKYARNKASLPLDSKFALMKQNPRTGKPLFCTKELDGDILKFDKSSWQKYDNEDRGRKNMLLKKMGIKEGFSKHTVYMDKMSNSKNKIAIIHADGNKMGILLQQMKHSLRDKSTTEIQNAYLEISKQIEKSTNEAVKFAYDENVDLEADIIQFRPIVIGGDDVTVLCSVEYALGFTRDYLAKFEENTKEYFKDTVEKYGLTDFKNGLTACAGIAFCQEKFPFHFAADLAEELCSVAKSESNREASCLAFHNIESSYFVNYKSYKKNELITHEGIVLSYAPYYVDSSDKKPTIEALIKVYEAFNTDSVPTGKFREYVSELHKSSEYAKLYAKRIDSVMESTTRKLLNGVLKKLHTKLSIFSSRQKK